MKKFIIDIDYKRKQTDIEKVSNPELTLNYIESLVSNKFPRLEGQKLRIFGRIQRKIDDAIIKKISEVELEDAEVDLLQDAVKDAVFVSGLAKYVVILIEAIEAL